MANISVSGKIIEEISEKVPSTNFAIIELIKNSYEAKASSISINIFDDKIEFFDDGDGMDSEDIKSLLVVSSSNKVYGKRIGKRIISGEKGHGFYSVFKFGSLVTIETIKNNTMNTFTLDMNVIRKASDISKYDIDINTISLQQKRNTGTKITVHNLYADSLNILKRSLDNKSKYSKLAKCIIDEEFNIEINKLWKNSIEYIENENIDKINEYFISVSKFNSTVHKKDNGEYFYTLQRLNDVINVEIPS